MHGANKPGHITAPAVQRTHMAGRMGEEGRREGATSGEGWRGEASWEETGWEEASWEGG
jgi:hypothetical protein